MKEKDELILSHVDRDIVSIRPVIDAVFGEGSTCDHVINRLVKEDRLVSEPGLPGGMCYYHLSLSEAVARSLPGHRARKKRGRALREAIQTLWFCYMSGKNRKRIERRQLKAHLADVKGSGKPHCAEIEEGQEPIVFRIYAPGPNSRLDYLLKTLRIDLEVAQRIPELDDWIHEEAFGFAVLVETPQRKEQLERLIRKQGPHNVKIVVEVVPGLSNLAMAVRERGVQANVN